MEENEQMLLNAQETAQAAEQAPQAEPGAAQNGNGAETPPETPNEDGVTEEEVAVWTKFFTAFPGKTAGDAIPKEVIEAAARGEDPALKMMQLENAALKQRVAALEAQARARRMSPGSLAGTAGGETDPVIALLLAD